MQILRLLAGGGNDKGDFTWIRAPCADDPRLDDAIWYFDGPMLYGCWQELRSTGFGIAVVAANGDLVAYGFGSPPGWCTTAAAAEDWALQEVLLMCPFPPQMRTDCQALLTTVDSGVVKAIATDKPLARIWTIVSHGLDGSFEALRAAGVSVWMPAHLSLASVCERELSTGVRLFTIDWRANRLVDGLAKFAAGRRFALLSSNVLANASKAVRHAAQLLGRVTHAANHHEVVQADADGGTVTKVFRDASKPVASRSRRCSQAGAVPRYQPAAEQLVPAALIAPSWTEMGPSPIPPPLAASTGQKSRARHHSAARAAVRAATRRIVERLGAASSVRSASLSAVERIEALRARVRAREAGQAGSEG